jgi:hypothetical protein
MKEFLWILAVRLLLVVSLMARLSLEVGDIARTMFGFGHRGQKHPNANFPFIHRQDFVGIIRCRNWLISHVSYDCISGRDIVGFSKRYNRKD